MTDLSEKNCLPCEDKTGKLEPAAAEHLLEELDKWKIIDDKKIEKTLQFTDFAAALKFINLVGEIAEKEKHHPDISLFSWNKVKFTLATHSIGGLSENDFILAAKIDEIAR